MRTAKIDFNKYLTSNLNGRVTHEKIFPLIDKLRKNNFFSVRKVGKSFEKREIFSVTFGKGKTKVLAWTQMHGDEPTATRAFFDFVNFISDEENSKIRTYLAEKLTIKFIPMLNPDGAERNIRYNALGIDINRDAQTLISPEALILEREFEKFKPHFALNLHDQDCGYSVGNTKEPVWLSFLATVGDEKKKETSARKKSMSVIGATVKQLRKSGIKNIARYNDDFEPRAFGDNFVKKRTAVILIEAGCASKDKNKLFERKIFFYALLLVLGNISDFQLSDENISAYKNLPENKELFIDLIIDNIKLQNGKAAQIGIRNGKIEAIGDLSIFGSYERINAQNNFLSKQILPEQKANFEIIDKNGKVIVSFKNGITRFANG